MKKAGHCVSSGSLMAMYMSWGGTWLMCTWKGFALQGYIKGTFWGGPLNFFSCLQSGKAFLHFLGSQGHCSSFCIMHMVTASFENVIARLHKPSRNRNWKVKKLPRGVKVNPASIHLTWDYQDISPVLIVLLSGICSSPKKPGILVGCEHSGP